MTSTNNPHHSGGDGGSFNGTAYATTTSVTGLAREIEGLRRELGELLTLPTRLNELAVLVAQLADATATPAGGVVVASWLDLPTDDATALAVLTELIAWMELVYLRYADAQSLPDCWLWHPDVIEELLWLMHAWLAAYHDEQAPVSLAADWHDRYRPGVARRINATAGRCSLEAHQPRADQPDSDAGPPVVPLAEAVAPIAGWWATHRSDPAPHPDPAHLATAAARRRRGIRR